MSNTGKHTTKSVSCPAEKMPQMYGGGGFHHNARDGNFGDYNNVLTPQDAEGDPNAQLLGLTTTGEVVQGVQGGHTGGPADRGSTALETMGAMAPGF